jgi:hypothetical protein
MTQMRFLTVCLMILMGLAASACGNRTNLAPVQSDQPLANTQLLTDIPIPNNATMDNERSLVLADRDHWVGRVVMRFWQSTTDLANFYQSQMPGFGWEPVMSVVSATSILTFTHGDHAATIQIEESTLGLKTQVSITVAPKQASSGQAPSSQGYSGSSYGGSTDYSKPAPIKSESLPPVSRH